MPDNISNLLSEQALNGDWEKLSQRISTAIEEVNKLSLSAKEITFNIQGDTFIAFLNRMNEAENNIKNMNETFTKVKATFNDLSSSTEKYGSTLTALIPTYADLKAQININNSEIKKYKDGITGAEKSIELFGKAILSNKEVSEQYNKIINENNTKIAQLESSNKALSSQLNVVAQIEKDLISTEIKLKNATSESNQALVEKKLTLSQISKGLITNALAEKEAFEKEVKIRTDRRLLNQQINREVREQTGEYDEMYAKKIENEERIGLAAEVKAQKISDANNSEYIANKKLEESVLSLQVAQEKSSLDAAEFVVSKEQQLRLNKLNAQLNLAETDSYKSMSAELSLLDIKIKNYSLEQIKSGNVDKDAIERHKQLTNALKEYDAILGVSTRNVGNYRSANEALANTKQEMIAIVYKGNEATEEELVRYKQLEEEAIKLTIAQKQVNTSLKETTSEEKEAATFSDKLASQFERSGIRMLASMIWIGLILGAITLLGEEWMKVSDATQIATDRLKAYWDEVKSHDKDRLEATPKTNAEIIDSKEKGDRIVSDMNRYFANGDLDKAFNKYKDLMQLFPRIFDAMDLKQFKQSEENGKMKEAIENMDKYNSYLKERATLEGLSKGKTLDIEENKDKQEILKTQIVKGIRNGGIDLADFKSYTGVDDVTKLKDDEIISLLQKSITKRNEEQNILTKYFKLDNVFSGVAQLNALQDSQATNQSEKDIWKSRLDQLQPKISDMEGNPKQPSIGGRKGGIGKNAGSPINSPDLTAEYEREKQYVNETIESNKKIVDDEKASLQDRLQANATYYFALYKLEEIEIERKKSINETTIQNAIKNRQKYQEELSRVQNGTNGKYKNGEQSKEIATLQQNIKIEENIIEDANTRKLSLSKEFQDNLKKLNDKSQKDISSIYISNEKSWLEGEKFAFSQQQTKVIDGYLQQELALKDSLDKKLISRRQYNSQVNQLEETAKIDLIKKEINFNDELLNQDKLTLQQDAELTKRNIELKKQLLSAGVDTSKKDNSFRLTDPIVNLLHKDDPSLSEKENDDILLKQKNDFWKKSVELAKGAWDAMNTIRNNAFAAEQQQLQIKQQELQIANQQQIQAINATTGYQITKDNQLQVQAAKSKSQQDAITKEQNHEALKKAEGDKTISEGGVIANTALAIAKTLPMLSNPATAAIGVAEIALISSLGAVQYAAAASTPLPQFFMGGTTETPYFSAGERGFELIKPIDKPAYFSSNTASIYNEKPGAKIISHDKTLDMIEYAVSNVVSQELPSSKQNENFIMKEVAKEVAKIINGKFEEVGSEIAYAVVRSSKPNVIINNNTNTSNLTWKIGR